MTVAVAMAVARILVVDDDRLFCRSTAALLRADGYEVESASNGHEAVDRLRRAHFDLMLLDVKMPGTDGIGVLEAIRLWGNGIPVLMISGMGTIGDAVRALHVGADDFLTKPVEPDVLSARVGELLERRPTTGSVGDDASRLASRVGMVGRSPRMRALFDAIRQVAATDATVLITGETGTGKELAAAAVHRASARRDEPFVAVDCGALSDGLLESELFGHVKGAFTGAVRDKVGLFESAGGGTIFLDEIGGVSFALQQRLLRVLQEREVTRVGAVRPSKVDVRVIAATNRDLRGEVQAGRFREDLFYRLNVFPLMLPPLRERREDVPLLVEHALVVLSRQRTASACCSPFAMRLLRSYDWPGNVRELFAVVESASIRAGDRRIEAQHLAAELRGVESHDAPRYRAGSDDVPERDVIVAALDEADGALNRAATLLGMGRTTLWRKLKAYGIDVHDHGGESSISGPALLA